MKKDPKNCTLKAPAMGSTYHHEFSIQAVDVVGLDKACHFASSCHAYMTCLSFGELIFHIFFLTVEEIRINRRWMWQKQRRKRNILGGHFSWVFRHKILFCPAEISILVHPKQILAVSKKWQKKKKKKKRKKKKKKKKKKKSSHFDCFPFQLKFPLPIYNFPYFFSISLFSLPLFSQLVSNNFPVKNVRGASCPPACYATGQKCSFCNIL